MPAGIYLHIPFCKSRCSYCDFATEVYRDPKVVDRYVDAICFEIHDFRSEIPCGIDTIYFGGGTPSLLTPAQLEQTIQCIRSRFTVSAFAEITMEMNPATVTPESLAQYRDLGVNRASFGVQSFDGRQLQLLGRGHDVKDVRETIRTLREAGFANVSFDLIAGLPDQTPDQWNRDLDEAIALSPEHISLYLLEIHSGTPLAEQVASGRRPMPDERVAAAMYETMLERLSAAHYEQYEISNFARPGFTSRHNTKYWRLDPVYGFGVSAHSFDGRQRYANERDTARYVELIETIGAAEVMREEVDLASEAAFLGLRMEAGINIPEFSQRFGNELFEKNAAEIDRLCDAGLLEIDDHRVKLTSRGKLFSNDVFALFV